MHISPHLCDPKTSLSNNCNTVEEIILIKQEAFWIY